MSRCCYNTSHLCWDWIYTPEAERGFLCHVYKVTWKQDSLLSILSLRDGY